MSEHRERLAWIDANIFPYEGDVRRWLRRSLSHRWDIDDIIQEAYCRIWSNASTATVLHPRAYFLQVVRNVVIDQGRRARVVKIDAVAEIEEFGSLDDEHSPERITSGRRDLDRLQSILNALPERSRRILEMRKILGLSQKEIARQLGVSENIVENDASRALRQVLKLYEQPGDQPKQITALSGERRPSTGKDGGGS